MVRSWTFSISLRSGHNGNKNNAVKLFDQISDGLNKVSLTEQIYSYKHYVGC